MNVISLDSTCMQEALREASMTMASGGVVCFPTETFYGLGARYDDLAACEKLYRLKGRPHEKALPLIVGARQTLGAVAGPAGEIEALLMDRFWPGPLTILFHARPDLPAFVTGGRPGRVAVRIPGRSFALALARSVGYPITATSANLSGMPAAERPDDVRRYFDDRPDLLIDGGRTPGGLSSTIVEVREGVVEVVRQGAVSRDAIALVLHSQGYRLK